LTCSFKPEMAPQKTDQHSCLHVETSLSIKNGVF